MKKKNSMWTFIVDYKHYYVAYAFSKKIYFKPKVRIEEDEFAAWIDISIGWFLLIFADWNKFHRRTEDARKTKK